MKLDVKHMDFYWGGRVRFGSLSKLDHDTILDVMDDYYNTRKKVAEICAEYGLTQNSRLAGEFPMQLLNEKCPYDGQRLVRFMPARNQDPEDYIKQCPKCGHEPYYGDECECAGCRRKRQARKDDEYQRIREYYSARRPKKKVPFKSLSPVDQLYLAAICFSQGSEVVRVDSNAFMLLTPSENWTGQIVKDFVERQILVVDPDSPAEAFKNYPPYRFDLLKVNYLINVDFGPAETDLFERMDWAELKKDKKACLEIWHKLNYWECMSLISFVLRNSDEDDYGFFITVNLELKQLLKDHSLKEAKMAIMDAYLAATTKKTRNFQIPDLFLEELADLAAGEKKINPETEKVVHSDPSVLKLLFYRDVLTVKVDAFEVVPSADLIAD